MTLARAAKALVGRAFVSTGMHRLALGNEGIVVAFHRVNDTIPEDGLTRSSRQFDRFCRFFKAYYDVVTLEDFVGRLERRESVAGALAITFDDGYLDNFEVAAPILRRLGLPATFFVATRFIESSTIAWWDVDLPRRLEWMSWEQVRTLSHEGFDIGAHTMTHIDLGTIEGDAAELEIVGSRADLEAALGRAPANFAFPYGQPNNMVESNRTRIRNAGFRCCVSCHGGISRNGSDPFRLPRVPIGIWYRTPEQFAFETAMRMA